MKNLIAILAVATALTSSLAVTQARAEPWDYWHNRVVADTGNMQQDEGRITQDKVDLARDRDTLTHDRDLALFWRLNGDRDQLRADRDRLAEDSAAHDRDAELLSADRGNMHESEFQRY